LGAITNFENGNLILVNSTLADNIGGALFSTMNATTILVNTILAGNTPQDCDGLVTSLGNNLIGDPTGCRLCLKS
jgi:hypothetical protein